MGRRRPAIGKQIYHRPPRRGRGTDHRARWSRKGLFCRPAPTSLGHRSRGAAGLEVVTIEQCRDNAAGSVPRRRWEGLSMRAPVRNALFAAMTASISATSSGISGAAITWANTSVHYDNGNYPSAAQGVGTGNWADAHDGALYDLWYHVNGQSGYLYDHGYLPTIATDTWGNYIDIHQASSIASAIWSKIGFDNGSGAKYMSNAATQIDFGYSPVIAVHGHNCVPGTSGSAPQPAFADIVQVHQADASGPTPLWMNLATATNIDCNNGGSTPRWGGVQWRSGQQYATGFYPSIAIDSFHPSQTRRVRHRGSSGQPWLRYGKVAVGLPRIFGLFLVLYPGGLRHFPVLPTRVGMHLRRRRRRTRRWCNGDGIK